MDEGPPVLANAHRLREFTQESSIAFSGRYSATWGASHKGIMQSAGGGCC